MVRGLLAALALLLPLSAGGLPTPNDSLPRISFTVRANKVILPATVGGSRPLQIIRIFDYAEGRLYLKAMR